MVDTIFEPAFKREAAGLTRKLALGGGYLRLLVFLDIPARSRMPRVFKGKSRSTV
jgi:hypothetical protein